MIAARRILSARRQSYRPYREIDQAALYRAHFGEDRRRRDPADVTVLPPVPADDDWSEAVRAAVLAVGAALLVILAWAALRAVLGVG